MNFLKKYLLELSVFVAGAVVMVFELTGSRIIAPYLGTSLYVWTSLIGIIMTGLSLGYWWGGKIADRKADYKTFSLIFWLSSLSMFFSDVSVNTLLFFPTSFLLGTISPYAVKLKLSSVNSTGTTVGNLYAISTFGSIVGTFLAGYLLIPTLGSQKIILLLSICLLVIATILDIKNHVFLKILSVVSISIFAFFPISKPDGLVDNIDTPYSKVWIFDSIDNGKKIRSLITDPKSAQSQRYLESDDLFTNYLKFYRLADYFNPDVSQALIIGGAGYSYPTEFINTHPNATLDVVEIDPGMTQIAKKYFDLKDNPRLTTYNLDGRIFLNKNTKIYDAIFIDAFNSTTIPFHLTTIEAVTKIHSSLSPTGIVILNLISAIEGNDAKFLNAEYLTYTRVFPLVRLYRVTPNINKTLRQNIILVALKTTPEISPTLNKNTKVLTDDHAPVEFMLY